MLGGVNSVASELARVYNSNNALLADTLTRIASGKKINRPSDDFVGYARSMSIAQDIDGYQRVKQNMTEAKAVADIASEAGNSIYEDLTRMKELQELYAAAGATADDQAAYSAEFTALKSSIAATVANSQYDGTQLVAAGTAISVDIDPDANGQFEVFFSAGDIVDTSALTITGGTTAAAAIQTELDTATLFVVKAESFSTSAQRQIDMTDTVIQSKQAIKSLITDIDEAEEMTNSIEMQIRQQASIAMLSQANLARQSIMNLYT